MRHHLLHQHEGHCHGHDHEHAHDHGHTHEHEHSHSHQHTHDGEHSHSHEEGNTGGAHSHQHTHTHAHDHTHDGEHSHGEAAPGGMEQTLAIMSYMLEHNRSHADELAGVADKLQAAGKGDAAQLIRDGVKEFGLGNDKLAQALKMVQEG